MLGTTVESAITERPLFEGSNVSIGPESADVASRPEKR
jgi:hypothetical protein